MARPTLLTDEVRDELEEALAAGVPVRIAAASVGVARPTVYEWMKRGLVERRPRLRLVESERPVEDELPEEEKLLGSAPRRSRGRDRSDAPSA